MSQSQKLAKIPPSHTNVLRPKDKAAEASSLKGVAGQLRGGSLGSQCGSAHAMKHRHWGICKLLEIDVSNELYMYIYIYVCVCVIYIYICIYICIIPKMTNKGTLETP